MIAPSERAPKRHGLRLPHAGRVRDLLGHPPHEAPIVPKNSISGRALTAVVAIMTFLASLTTGAVLLVLSAASDWQADVSREVTVQVRPVAGQDLEQAVERAVAIARGTPGVTAVRAQTREESARLLEPWLGSGVSLDSLPVPRLVLVQIATDRPPDLAGLRATLASEVPGATLDDHRGFTGRLRAMADTTMMGGLAVLLLVMAATVLSVGFATRGAMATNRTTVEVLHFIGAKDAYVAGQFMRHFLLLGLHGGLIGGGAAIVVFLVLGAAGGRLLGGGAADLATLFGGLSLGIGGYVLLLLQILVIAAVTAFTSRRVVKATLAAVA
ncbi:cell division protein FtsX [Rhodovulum sp. PH10]|uniref:cell division protein FtsX n=1 Tax=Rhodovulum sp. PH10 TaxID=1187851 RepID=UPI00192B38B6|nr:ABC transporter permease [Rhodovulum sp. PH10]